MCPPPFFGTLCEKSPQRSGDLGEGRVVQMIRYFGLLAAVALIVGSAFLFGWRAWRQWGDASGYTLVPTVDRDEVEDVYAEGFHVSGNVGRRVDSQAARRAIKW